MMHRLLIAIFAGILSASLLAQPAKQEIEKRIDRGEVPDKILDRLQPFEAEWRKVKYYLDIDGEQRSYEAKFKWREQQLSVEFYPDGQLMDIERLVSFESISDSLRNSLTEYFESTYDKYKIKRVQRQYSSDSLRGDQVIQIYIRQKVAGLDRRVELVLETKKDKQNVTYEYVFDRQGNVIRKTRIVRRSADNILYR